MRALPLLLLLTIGAAAVSGHALAQTAARAEDGPRWQELAPAERSVLKPLERDWSSIDAARKQVQSESQRAAAELEQVRRIGF